MSRTSALGAPSTQRRAAMGTEADGNASPASRFCDCDYPPPRTGPPFVTNVEVAGGHMPCEGVAAGLEPAGDAARPFLTNGAVCVPRSCSPRSTFHESSEPQSTLPQVPHAPRMMSSGRRASFMPGEYSTWTAVAQSDGWTAWALPCKEDVRPQKPVTTSVTSRRATARGWRPLPPEAA